MRALVVVVTSCAIAAVASSAAAEPIVLKMASIIPDGTAWARELRSFASDVEHRTEGRVRVKWYMNGVAGTELEIGERIRRGELDGTAAGGPLCQQVMPSWQVMSLPALLQTRGEANRVMAHLRPTFEAEAAEHGFVYGLSTVIGNVYFFGRRPVQSMAELRATPSWEWNLNFSAVKAGRAMGLTIEPSDLGDARKAYERHQIDGFWAPASAALAFQWSVSAPYLLELSRFYLCACGLLAQRSFLRIDPADQRQIVAAMAQVSDRFSELNESEEKALLGGVFQHQGVTVVPIGKRFRAEFFAAAREARDRVANSFVSEAVMREIRQLLADYRAEQEHEAQP